MIAALFALAGVLIGSLLFGNSLSRADVEDIVREVVKEELSGLTVAGGVDAAAIEAIVASALQNSGSGSPASQYAAIADNDPFQGNPDGVVTIVEFSDFNCGFCTRFAMETLPQILENYGDRIKFVYRDMPILAETSAPAAEASHCAHDQGKFWEFHNLMFTDATARTREAYIKFAQDNNLDVTVFTECIDSGKYSGEVTLDLIDGQGLGIRGTPAFYINGRMVSGAQPYEVFQTVIEAELAKLAEQEG
jgi:protein-disulfide isomerase